MESNIEKLMQPRYEVVADYPHSPFSKGEVLTGFRATFDNCCMLFSEKSDSISENDANKYPHLFKRLRWYEHRVIEDMPEYVKDNRIGNIVIKVHKWREGCVGFISEANKDNGFFSDIRIFVPATEQEYQQFITSPRK